MLFQNSFNIVTNKFQSVVTCPNDNVSNIPDYIIYTVRHDLALSGSLEIMVVGFRISLTIDLPCPLEVSYQLLLLCVDTDYWYTCLYGCFLHIDNKFKLFVSVFDFLHRKVLEKRAVPVSSFNEQLFDYVVGHLNPLFMHPFLYLAWS